MGTVRTINLVGHRRPAEPVATATRADTDVFGEHPQRSLEQPVGDGPDRCHRQLMQWRGGVDQQLFCWDLGLLEVHRILRCTHSHRDFGHT